jgi:hypothetical protein
MGVMGILAELNRSELDRHEAAGELRVVGNLKVYCKPNARDAGGSSWHVKVWSGKASKPYANFLFKNESQANEYVAKQVEADAAASAYKQKRNAERKAKSQEVSRALNIGDILVNSWGYEQTNVDFYQVVDKKGMTVALRKIAGEPVPGSHYPHGMACMVRPCPGAFIGEPFLKRISAYGVKMPYGGHASKCAPDSTHYNSWYA